MKLEALIVLVLVLAVGCSGAAPSPSPAPDVTSRANNQISLTLTLDQPSRVTGVISEGGGVLATTASDGARYSLEVPPGALPDPTEVTLTPVASIAGLPPGGEVLAAVHFSPEGLDFQQPATVTIELPAGVNPDEIIGFAFVGDGEEVYRFPVEAEGSDLRFTITHFSGIGALLGVLSNVYLQGVYLPTRAEALAVQSIAATADLDVIADILLNWYKTVVKPYLTAAETDDSLLPDGLSDFVPWRSQVELNGMFDTFSSQITEGFDLIASGLRNGIDQANQRCLAQGDWQKFVDVENWIATAARLNLDTPERELDLETLKPNFCVKVVFESTTFPEEIEADEEVELSTKIGWKIGSGPVMHNPGISLEASFIGSSRVDITEKGETDDLGNFSTNVRLGANSNEITAKIAACFREVAIACSTNQVVAQGLSGMDLKVKYPDETDADLESKICIANGDQARLVAFLKKGKGGLAGRAVQFSLDGQGSLDSPSGFTDIDGRVSVDFTAPGTGEGLTKTTASYQQGSESESSSLDIEFGSLLRVVPGDIILSPGDSLTFTVSRCGPGSSDAVWAATGGVITAAGLYTAGLNAGVFSVTATSTVDPSKSAQGTVVIQAPQPTVPPSLNFSGSYTGTSTSIGTGDTRPCGGAAPPCLSVSISQSIADGSTVISLFWCGHISFSFCKTNDGSSCRILYEGTGSGNEITVNAVQWLDLCNPSRQPNRVPPVGTITGTLVEGTLSGILTIEEPVLSFSVTR